VGNGKRSEGSLWAVVRDQGFTVGNGKRSGGSLWAMVRDQRVHCEQ
jgi:hypothetical protein